VESILSRVKRTIDDFGLLKAGDKILIALSGGPDSVVLLHLLHLLKGHYNITLAAAHLDHGLRAQAAQDREFCVRICKDLKIRLFSKKVDIAIIAKRRKISIEEAGRQARYGYFELLAQKHGFTKIATGHTLDDNAETVLFNLARGCGLDGLAGIPYRRDKIIRPLLRVEKAELLAWLKAEKIGFVRDKSNRSLKYARNRIRHKVIPELGLINGAAVRNIARMSDIAKNEIEFLESLTVSAFKEVLVETGKSKIVLDLGKLVQYDKSLRKRMLEKAAGSLAGGVKGISSDNLFRAFGVIDGKSGGKAPLGRGLFIEKSQGRIAIMDTPEIPETMPLSYPGDIKLQSGETIRLRVVSRDELTNLDRGFDSAYLDLGKLAKPCIRYWQDGDTIRPLGMKGSKLLSDIFIDKKIPEYERGLVPLIVSGNKIAWVAGVMISDEFKVSENTKEVLSLELCKP
jgi:tRNA(Ile)-lysidine synthase